MKMKTKTSRASNRNVVADDIVDVSTGWDSASTITVTLVRAWRHGEDTTSKVTLKLDDYMALAVAKEIARQFRARARRAEDDVTEILEATK